MRQRQGSCLPLIGSDGDDPAARGQACQKPFIQRTAPLNPVVVGHVGATRNVTQVRVGVPDGCRANYVPSRFRS